MTLDMWHMLGVKYYLKNLGPQLLYFGMNSVLPILNKGWLNEWMSNRGDCRKSKATTGLLKKCDTQHVTCDMLHMVGV